MRGSFYNAAIVAFAYAIGVLNERYSPGDHGLWNATTPDWLAIAGLTILVLMVRHPSKTEGEK